MFRGAFGFSRPVLLGTTMKPIQRSPGPEHGVNGEEDDTLSKARKAAKAHLHALKEHVDQVGIDRFLNEMWSTKFGSICLDLFGIFWAFLRLGRLV